jgi:hypothetical protein
VRRKAAEHDRVDSSEPGAGEHRDHGLGNHRHVDDDAVAALDALRRERAGEARHLVAQLAVGVHRLGVRHRRVVDQRELVAAAAFDVTVERVVAAVQASAYEPTVEGRRGVVEHPRPRRVPVDR